MKKLLIAMLFVPMLAHAERWFEMRNNAGGKIILTEYKCETGDGGKMVISTTKDGTTIQGCWFFFTDMVHIRWDSGTISSFNPNEFTMKERK